MQCVERPTSTPSLARFVVYSMNADMRLLESRYVGSTSLKLHGLDACPPSSRHN